VLDREQGLSMEEQSMTTLLVTNSLLPFVRGEVPGFVNIERHLVEWLNKRYSTTVELFFAHGLRQGPQTLRSTGFDVHQDTEDFDFIEYTVVVKLTQSAPGEPPSQMTVVGAQHHFDYGAGAGAAGAFLARLHHASVAPRAGSKEHLKMAL
jgi:hypothetical protein